LINNAAVHYVKTFLDTETDEWDTTMNVNLRTPFILSREVLRLMKERRSGYIINISSSVAFSAANRVMAYSVSKVALKGMSDALYQEAVKYGVKVSTIYPGIVNTKMVEGTDLPGGPDTWMNPGDISRCVLFLLGQSPQMLIRDLFPTNMYYNGKP